MKKGGIIPFIKIWIHLIWSTKERQPLISQKLKKELFCHIRENTKKKEIYLDFINVLKDHVHLLVSLKANQNISKITQLIKGESSHWINENKLTGTKFEWQDEYIAVSVSESIVNRVRKYIKDQDEHHRKKTFQEEYNEFARKYGFDRMD